MATPMTGPALVLSKFAVNEDLPKEEPPIIEIEGRKPGFLAFVLTIMRINSSTRLTVTSTDVSFRSGSMFGEITSVMPLSALASAHSGLAKPIERLAGAVAIFMGAMSTGLGMMASRNAEAGMAVMVLGGLVAFFLLVSYILSKKMAIFVESSGGATFGLVFKPSIIEGVTVDDVKVRAVVGLIRDLAARSQRKG